MHTMACVGALGQPGFDTSFRARLQGNTSGHPWRTSSSEK